jgi:hypothetical protein
VATPADEEGINAQDEVVQPVTRHPGPAEASREEGIHAQGEVVQPVIRHRGPAEASSDVLVSTDFINGGKFMSNNFGISFVYHAVNRCRRES